MITQYIQLGDRGWNVLVYYDAKPSDFFEIRESLIQLDCQKEYIEKIYSILHRKNTGFTFSNSEYKMSIVCISNATSPDQFLDTAIHEAKHVQSHICEYYDIDEDSEQAAYLIGYIARRMYKMISKIIM